MIPDGSKPKNIFEAASRIEQERKEKKRPAGPSPSATLPSQKNASLDEIFRRCHQMHKEIVESLDHAFKQAGVTHSQLQSFVSKPRNFSSGDWSKVEEGKKQSEEMLTELKSKIGSAPELKRSEPPKKPPEPPQKKPPEPPPKKKAKIVTRRQWIGM